MEIPLQITTRNIDLSEATMDDLRKKAAKLDTFYDRLTRCRITVEVPHRYKKPELNIVEYNIHIDMTVPGRGIAIKNRPSKDLDVAIREAFDAAQRKLEEFSRKQRNEVKHHDGPPHGVVDSIFPDKGYGFLATEEGREIYFHKNSVLNSNFRNLRIGSVVRFNEEEGDKGPQASTVVLETP